MDKDVPLQFPLAGLNVATEFGRPPKLTAPVAANVRAHDALANRKRGGSRPGLSRLAAGRVPAGANLIQHLNVVVDPTEPALAAGGTLDLAGDELYEDPHSPGTYVRKGGSGIQMGRNVSHTLANTPASIAFVRKQHEFFFDAADGTRTMTLSTQPGLNNLLVVVVTTLVANVGAGPTACRVSFLRNALLNEFTQLGAPLGYADTRYNVGQATEGVYEMSMWYRIADAGANDTSIRFTVANGGVGRNVSVSVLEYSGADAEGPSTHWDKGESADDVTTTSLALPAINMNGTPGQLVVAAFAQTGGTSTAPSGYTERFGDNVATSGYSYAFDKIGAGTTAQVTHTVSSARVWVGMAASFHT